MSDTLSDAFEPGPAHSLTWSPDDWALGTEEPAAPQFGLISHFKMTILVI